MNDREPEPFDPSADQSPREKPVERNEPVPEAERPTPGLREHTAPPQPSTLSESDLNDLGRNLAQVLTEGVYHPVILLGTNNSGKTCILLSLFALLKENAQALRATVRLGDSLLGASQIGVDLHTEAEKTFEIRTRSFIAGEEVQATTFGQPFFIPVELKPADNKPPVRLAFLESKGEWYRALREQDQAFGSLNRLYPKMRGELESFVSTFQRPITFVYVAPYTQAKPYTAADRPRELFELERASDSLAGVMKEYHRRRILSRESDRHLMLVTKWDQRSAGKPVPQDWIGEDREALERFFSGTYAEAEAEYLALEAEPSRKALQQYSAGMMLDNKRIEIQPDNLCKAIIDDYPTRLWSVLYGDALEASGGERMSPFPDPPREWGPVRLAKICLDWISGHR